jgi:LAO/AO transport system kinase
MPRESQGDSGTLIRSLGSRGDAGGLSAVTWDAARIMDASGRDVIFIETVGAGQGETEIAAGAHTVVVVTVPGLGDSIQAMKAGLMEIADVLVVNMADRPGVREAVRALRSGVRPLDHGPSPWKVPIVTTEAVAGRGVEELWATIVSHREHLQATGAMADRRRDQARAELLKRLERRWRRHLRGRLEQDERLTRLAEQVVSGGLGVDEAVGLLWRELGPSE